MDGLWLITEKENIRCEYRNLLAEQEHLYGLYIFHPVLGPVIILDESLKNHRRLHKCVLAEEIGHYNTAPRSNYLIAYGSYNNKIIMSQDERKALQWATDFLIPDVDLTKAVHSGCRSCFELAEYFDVTEWLVYRKLGFLKMCFRRTGLKVRGKDLFDIQTAPCLYL